MMSNFLNIFFIIYVSIQNSHSLLGKDCEKIILLQSLLIFFLTVNLSMDGSLLYVPENMMSVDHHQLEKEFSHTQFLCF